MLGTKSMDVSDYNLMVGFLDPWQTNGSLYVVISGQNVATLQDSWTLPLADEQLSGCGNEWTERRYFA